MKYKVVVGCPIFERAWVLQKWLDAVAAQDAEITLAFVHTPGEDNTREIIEAEKSSGRFADVFVEEFPGGNESNDRDWSNEERVAIIAAKRNKLMDLVARINQHRSFDYFLTLDSDVLIPKGGLMALIAVLEKKTASAVCAKVWIWDAFFVAARYIKDKVQFVPRRRAFGVQQVDIVTSGGTLMTRDLATDRKVRYGVARVDKDFGWAPGSEVDGWNASECIFWSREAKKAGYKLAVNCDVTFEHKMQKEVGHA